MCDQNKTRFSSDFPTEEIRRAVENSAGRRRILIDAEEGPNLDEDSYTDLDASPLSPELLAQVPRQITPNSSARRQLGPRLEATYDESVSVVPGTQMDPSPPPDEFESQLHIARFMTTFATTVREREGGGQEFTTRERVEESDDGTGGGWYDNSTNDRNGTDENIFSDPLFESPPPPPCFDYESEPPPQSGVESDGSDSLSSTEKKKRKRLRRKKDRRKKCKKSKKGRKVKGRSKKRRPIESSSGELSEGNESVDDSRCNSSDPPTPPPMALTQLTPPSPSPPPPLPPSQCRHLSNMKIPVTLRIQVNT